ncbi:MAG: Tfx family DNA-binding protein [Methanothrix sp.]|nr:Tfx family DNA-binding protein [Methanothrix sp.]
MPRKQKSKDPEEENKSLLTESQVQVLKLRSQGRTQQEVADLMGTTRANVSKLERRGHKNIMMARQTIQDWMKVKAPVSMRIPAGTDVLSVPAMVFRAADLEGIHLPVNSIDVLVQLKTEAPFLFKKQVLPIDVDIFVSREGHILIIDEKGEHHGQELE